MKKERSQFRDHQAEVSLFKRRALAGFIGIIILSFVLIGNLYHLEVQDYSEYTARSNDNRIKIIPVAPNRGRIYDRNGVILAENIPVYSLEIIPEKVAHLTETLDSLKTLLGVTDDEIDSFMKDKKHTRPFMPVTLIDQMTEKQVAEFSVNEFHYPGVDVDAHLERYYPYGSALTHTLGYVAKINDRDIKSLKEQGIYSNYKATRTIGKLGVERYYEDLLHGQSGYEKVEVNNRGRIIRTLEYVPPISGKDIKLTIDLNLQLYANKLLTEDVKDPKTGKMVTKTRRGAIVVLNPQDDGILAMVSSPSYDPNLFVHGITSKEYSKLLNSPAHPLVNRTTLGVYPPGSTVKPQIAVAALATGVITPNTVRNNPGWWRIPNSKSRKFRDDVRWGHGNVDVYKAIEQSVDTFFYQVAYDMGIDRISTWMNKFGYGELTGIDIKEETSGNMPTRQWKLAHTKQPWYQGDTIPIGIGQGYWTATPMQIAKATSVVANSGVVHRPHLLYAILDGKKEDIVKFKDFPKVEPVPLKDWQIAQEGMHLVTTKGTARKEFKNLAYEAAGKTGTSQVYTMSDNENYDASEVAEHLRDHALFTGFAPLHDPKVLVSVILEHGGWGRNAAPLARKIMDYVLVKPTLDPAAQKQVKSDGTSTESPVDVSKTAEIEAS
ncbi:penicillin-binding protein 2 [Photobacterium angustum]|uniref:penicillin-binding protein 2 n=1 Tax=Photobacterium angustum TaxID=661 RepID=UPI0005DEBDCC|nr:penicillin-binding protein 2 [Photobacterium angustum]KJG03163.1 penicillin-binding protein 2 [Photobacterium angustum]PSV66245.1 penicillin-binding protein 2 [Photobacterium angustum]